jgi:hypothetical protein
MNIFASSRMSTVKWVAVGYGDDIVNKSILWSPDGRTWNDASSGGFGGAGGFGKGIAYDGSIWVAVGNGSSANNNILWSPDGTTWNDASSGGFGGGGGYFSGNGIAYDGIWVAVGDGISANNNILWSPDGKSWNDASSGVTFRYGMGIASDGKGFWVATGSSGSTNSTNLWSTDGRTWNDASSGGFGGGGSYFGGVAYNGIWVAVGGGSNVNNSILWSTDGTTWNDASSGGFGGGGNYGYGIASDGKGMWVAVGEGSSANNNILWSTDGRTWNDASSGGFSYRGGYGVAYDGKWIAVGYEDTPEKTILWSTDGKTWYDASGGFIFGFGVASNSVLPRTSQTPLPCFLKGTRILTPTGYKKIEEIESGDHILTSDNRKVPVKLYQFTTQCTEETAPFCIPAGALGDHLPSRDLHISGNHAIQIQGSWQIPRYLAENNSEIQQHSIGSTITYYHIECPNYINDNLIAEGVTAESFNTKTKVQWKRTETGYTRKLPLQKGWWNKRKV